MTDVTTTAAWRRLTDLRASFTPDLRGWFAADPDRARTFTRDAGDLHVDLSKNLIDDQAERLLLQLDQIGNAALCQIEQAVHLDGVVDGPHVHLHLPRVRGLPDQPTSLQVATRDGRSLSRWRVVGPSDRGSLTITLSWTEANVMVPPQA